MKKLINTISVFLFLGIVFLTYNSNPTFAGCCCHWYSCGYSGGNYACGCTFVSINVQRGCTSGCSDYSCACPPPPCDNSCDGSCTLPSCPAGYTRTNPNNLCSNMTAGISCTYKNDCNNNCTDRATCYKIETNVTEESQSTSLNMVVDGESYALSLNSATPVTVKYPSTQNNVQTSLPIRATPSTASGLGYAFRANNYGTDNDEWLLFDCARAEDFCIESTNNVQNFTPSSLSILQVLKENAQGQISGLYYTVNLCNTGKLYSLPLETYYKVDNEPDVVDVCDSDPSLLASDPGCDPDDPVCPLLPDPEPGPNEQCAKEEFLPEVGEEDSTSFKGCHSEEYTGREVNNPLKIRVGSRDIDGNDEIKGAVVWFSKDDITPELPKIVSEYNFSSTNDLGIMILQDNNSWSNPPVVYGITSEEEWGPLNDGTLRNSSLDSIARVSDVTVTQGDEIVTFELNLELIPNFTDNLGTYDEGEIPYKYKFKSIVLDQYMLLSDGRVDISHMQRYFDWGIDLVVPSMTDLSQEVLGPQELYLNWNVDGTGSNITDSVINGYRDGFLINDTISLPGYSDITLDNIPPEDQIGLMNDINSWKYTSVNPNPYINTSNTRISINRNEGGSVIMYLTAFDQGCNDNLREHNIDLRPWIATKGGIVYSQGSLGSSAKVLEEKQELALSEVLKRVKGNELDTGTELVSSRMDFINNLIHPELGAVRAINTYDSNDRKTYWYEYFKKKLEVQRANLTEFKIDIDEDTAVFPRCSGENCLMYSKDNIEIPSGYVCNRNTLFISEKNIIINPDVQEVENNQNTTGCLFVAKENIIIKEGNRRSTSTSVGYDYIEGFMFADNQILIEIADAMEIVRDGLEVKGGLIALGSISVDLSSINIERNLRLFNYSHPTLVVNWNVKYARLSEIFFGTEAPMYKQEVGFKVF